MNYKIFGNTGLKVSELCLGTMTFGNDWGWGAEKDEAQKIFDYYLNEGGNFIDTANIYSNGGTEKMLGEFIQSERDSLVLATKFTLKDTFENPPIDPNLSGSHKKNMMRSVEASLKRINTDFIDILWVHAWDEFTAPQELMRNLEELVKQGKILHIAISDTPAWQVAICNTIAEMRGWNCFAGLQVEYSLIQRSAERDLIPMSKSFGLTLTPWSPLGGGILSGKFNIDKNTKGRANNGNKLTEKRMLIAQETENIAKQIEAETAQVALQWIRQKQQNAIPIIGARTLDQLKSNLACLKISLSENEMAKLDKVSEIELGFPHDFLNSENIKSIIYSDCYSKIMK